MTCQAAQELILESLDCRIDEEQQIRLESHIAQCEMCRSFREVQRVLDAALAFHCVAPQLSPAFRSKLAREDQRSRRGRRVRNGSQTCSILAAGLWPRQPVFCGCLFHPPQSLTVGIALTFVSYALQTMFRFWLEDLEGL